LLRPNTLKPLASLMKLRTLQLLPNVPKFNTLNALLNRAIERMLMLLPSCIRSHTDTPESIFT